MNNKGKIPPLFSEGLRFTIVGLSNFLVSLSVFHLCYTRFHIGTALLNSLPEKSGSLAALLGQAGIVSIDASIATAIGYFAGVLNSYVWNRAWTFKVRSRDSRQFSRFLTINFLGLCLSSGSMFYFVDILSLPYLVTWLVVMSIVTVLNFLGSKYWAFAQTG